MGKKGQGSVLLEFSYFGKKLLKDYYKQMVIENQVPVLDHLLVNRLRRLFVQAVLKGDANLENKKFELDLADIEKNTNEKDRLAKEIKQLRTTLMQNAIKQFDDAWGALLLTGKNSQDLYEGIVNGQEIAGYKVSNPSDV